MKRNLFISLSCFYMLFFCGDCKKKTDAPTSTVNPTETNEVSLWKTSGSGTELLKKQPGILSFKASQAHLKVIAVDSSTQFQQIDGFGFTLTGGSAYHINRMSETEKNNLLNELFGNGENSIGISYLRVSIGASDLDAAVFSYNDLPAGQTDLSLSNFSLANDTVNLIPVLKKILQINPSIKILGSPWSAPVWMKDNGNSVGGSLQPQFYSVYANYFVKYIQKMAAYGINIDAITIQNEPFHPGNNPSMFMTALQQADFIKNHLGPAFAAAGIQTKIIIWDHNCNHPEFPITVLNDAGAKQYINGSAFHLYEGDISALATVRTAHPDKALYFTEQWTGANGTFSGDLQWHVKNVLIGSMRNYSRIALEWNLASDALWQPHTPGGCTECKGALTITGNNVSRNVSYYIIGHASKFVPAGSVRIGSDNLPNLPSVAFKTPEGKKVLIVVNDRTSPEIFDIKYKNKYVYTNLDAGAVGTYVW